MCKSCATHEHLSRATCRVPHGMKGQLSYWVMQSWNFIYFSFILLAETITDEGGVETSVPGEKPLTMIFRKCHILKRENSSPNPDSNSHFNIGGRLRKKTCKAWHHTWPQDWNERGGGTTLFPALQTNTLTCSPKTGLREVVEQSYVSCSPDQHLNMQPQDRTERGGGTILCLLLLRPTHYH